MTRWILLSLFGMLLSPVCHADDFDREKLDNWHQWRGPLANGTAPHGQPPLKWAEQTNVKWKAEIPGLGSSTPIVWKDQVFVLTVIDTGRQARAGDLPKGDPRFEKKTQGPGTYHQFVVLSYDRKTGAVRWKQVATEQVPHEGRHPTHTYAAYSPSTDGRFLYVSFGSRGIYCYDLDGKLQWHRDLGRMETRLGWGEGASPTLHGDALIVNWDHEGKSFLAVLDTRTGKTRWQVDRDEVTTWATPLVVEHKGRTQVIINATKRIRSYDLATGELIWQCGGLTVNCIPSPVRYGDLVICMSGYRGAAAFAIPLDAHGDITGSDKIIWHFERGTPYVPSPLLTGDRLYFTQANNAQLTCLDARTGKVLIDRERLPGLTTLYASPVEAAGRIYIADRDGTTLVLKRSDKLEVLATNRLGESLDASPVIVGQQLFLRGPHHLYCLQGE
jgi:outer membrane protein assembly factor BamB